LALLAGEDNGCQLDSGDETNSQWMKLKEHAKA